MKNNSNEIWAWFLEQFFKLSYEYQYAIMAQVVLAGMRDSKLDRVKIWGILLAGTMKAHGVSRLEDLEGMN
jgi:hypothetical protein